MRDRPQQCLPSEWQSLVSVHRLYTLVARFNLNTILRQKVELKNAQCKQKRVLTRNNTSQQYVRTNKNRFSRMVNFNKNVRDMFRHVILWLSTFLNQEVFIFSEERFLFFAIVLFGFGSSIPRLSHDYVTEACTNKFIYVINWKVTWHCAIIPP